MPITYVNSDFVFIVGHAGRYRSHAVTYQPHAPAMDEHAAGDNPEGGRRDLPQVDPDSRAPMKFEPSTNCSRDQPTQNSAIAAAEKASVEMAVVLRLKMPSTCLK